MWEVFARLARFGWLPLGQGGSLVVSTVGFAILARTLGPLPFAHFATILFVFTLISLVMDLSPQGFILVNGDRREVVRAAWRVALSGGVVASTATFLASQVAYYLVFSEPLGLVAPVVLAVTCFAQFVAQVPRARVMVARRYRAIAIIDVTSATLSVAFAVALSVGGGGVEILCFQLLCLAVAKAIGAMVLGARIGHPSGSGTSDLSRSAFLYGLSVMPLNLASYATRSVDAGVLPALIPAAAAAAYARSYQIVVTPITQLQLSLGAAIVERFARAKTEGSLVMLRARVWRALIHAAGAAGVMLSIFSWLVALVLFGNGWPQSPVFISGMACGLPALSLISYSSWSMQLAGVFRQSLRQLLVLLLPPVGVIAAAASFGVQGAVAALVLAGGVTPALVLSVNREAFRPGPRLGAMLAQVLTWWFAITVVFVVVSFGNGFWQFGW